MQQYKTYSFSGDIDWQAVPVGKIERYFWNTEKEYDVSFRMCFAKDRGIYLRMACDETELRTETSARDEAVYEDSCMEMFLCTLEGRKEYVNFEISASGAYLCEFGPQREGRAYIKDLTGIAPEVKTQRHEKGWSAELFVPCELISALYGATFTASACTLRGNFCKCGDKTRYIHYGSFAEMKELPPGFHNPERFAEIIIEER